jgi:hypothetical protein
MNKEIESTMRFDIKVKKTEDSKGYYFNIQSIKLESNEMKSSQTSNQQLPKEKITRKNQTASRIQAPMQPPALKKQQTTAKSQSQRPINNFYINNINLYSRDSDSDVEEEPRKKKQKKS